LQHASPVTAADALERSDRDAAPAGGERGAGGELGGGGARRGLADRATLATTVLLAVALLAGAVYLLLMLSDYRRIFVHPDNHQFILKEGLRDGVIIGWRDFPNSLQLRAPDEFRPRFITYYLLEVDQKLRLMIYDWMPAHPTLMPVAWLLYLVGVYYLYRLMLNLTGKRLAGLASAALFVSAIGFLSAFSMQFMPGKPLSSTALIMSLYAVSEAVKRLSPGGLFVQAPGIQKYLALLWLVLGLFLDEMPIASLMIVPLVFWPYFVPRWPWKRPDIVAFVKNGLFFSIPALAFLGIVVFVIPPLTQYLFGYWFDYLGDILLIHGNTRSAPSLEVAVQSGLEPWVLVGNVTTLFGLSLAPWTISPLVYTINDVYPGGQVTNLPKIAILVLFFAAALYLAIRCRGPVAMHLRGLLLSLPPFILFLSLLMARHIPVVTGYYYGAIFASIFAILVGLMLAGVAQLRPKLTPVAALLVLAMVGTQLANFHAINDGWRILHDEGLTRQRLEKARMARDRRIPVAQEARPLTREELRAIWSAWKAGRLDRYMRDNSVSASAVFEVVELQELDRAR
jgi:hypothetical protein